MSRKKKIVYVGGKHRLLWTSLGFVLGAVTAPMMGPVVRPLLKGTVKTGILAGREMKRMFESAREDIEDLAADAVSDLDKNNKQA
jgi:hypothetical protein